MTDTCALLHRLAELKSSGVGGDGGSKSYVPHEPSPKQARFLELDCLEALYGGAAGGGKSDALLMAALKYVHIPDYSAILFRRTFTDLALPGAIMDRSHEWLSSTDAHWQGEIKTWRFPSGATLAFGYLDGPRDHMRYKSTEFQFVGFDEVTEFWEQQYTYLFSRLRRRREIAVPLRMRCASNPGDIGHDWVKRRFIDEPEGRVFVPATLEDNEFIDRDAYDTALSQLDPVTYAQLRRGEWVRDTSGLVYGAFTDANVVDSLPALPRGEQWRHIIGCDFGVTDPTAFAVLAYSDHVPAAYVVESDEWAGISPSQAAEKWLEWNERYKFEVTVGDIGGLGKAFEKEWETRFSIPMEPAEKQNKLGYIKLLNGDYSGRKLYIVRALNEKLIKDTRALAWADEKHLKEHPQLPNHLPDAKLYAWRRTRHFNATARKVEPAYGTPEWFAAEQERRLEARRERVEKMNNREWWEEYADA